MVLAELGRPLSVGAHATRRCECATSEASRALRSAGISTWRARQCTCRPLTVCQAEPKGFPSRCKPSRAERAMMARPSREADVAVEGVSPVPVRMWPGWGHSVSKEMVGDNWKSAVADSAAAQAVRNAQAPPVCLRVAKRLSHAHPALSPSRCRSARRRRCEPDGHRPGRWKESQRLCVRAARRAGRSGRKA